MSFLHALTTQPFFTALGWALLHFVWQGIALAILLQATLSLLRGRDSNTRYMAASAVLLLMLAFPALTTWKLITSPQSSVLEVDDRAQPTHTAASEPRLASGAGETADHPKATVFADATRTLLNSQISPERLDMLLPWLVLAWTLGVLILSARMLGGLIYTQRLKLEGVSPAPGFWQDRVKAISRQFRIGQSVKLLESSIVQIPTTIGWLRPVILVPFSSLAGLTPQQLELILTHELAHIRRHDYAVNLLQSVAEILLFYHPAVWWVSRQVRIEREHACDDLAVRMGGDAVVLARALTKLERLRTEQQGFAMAADGGELKTRVLRLVLKPRRQARRPYMLIGFVFLASLLLTINSTRIALSEQQPQTATIGNEVAFGQATTSRSTQRPAKADMSLLSTEVASLIAKDRTVGEDDEVRRVAIAALENHAGSVVVMDPRNGRVYTIVNQEWALRQGWTPASMMKLVTSLAGLGESLFNPAESVRVSDRKGPLNLTDALAISNNQYFSSLADRVGADRIVNYAQRLGLGERTGINYENEIAGSLPSAQRVPSAARLGAYGEGAEVTPIQLATLVSAIASGGKLFVPRVPESAAGDPRFEPRLRRELQIPPAAVQQIIPGMIAAVERGTATGAQSAEIKVVGKTGSVSNGASSLGIFASYAPANDPRMVVVVLTKGPKESGAVAATLAGTIYRDLNKRL
jgi:beta-lactamase regulating signal transducer with metallopeptidase domain